MKLLKLIEKLQGIYEEHGNINTVCRGDHQEEYKVEYVSVEYIQDGECGGYNVLHRDDICYYEDPEMVVSIS